MKLLDNDAKVTHKPRYTYEPKILESVGIITVKIATARSGESNIPILEMVEPMHECDVISITQATYMQVISEGRIQQKSALVDSKL